MTSSSALKMSYEDRAGVLKPTGFFDPLGLSNDIDEETFTKYRTAELKHGRVAQLAVLGYIVPEFFRLNGAIDVAGRSFDDVPNGVLALSGNGVSALGWAQIILSVGWWELKGWKQASDAVGDFGFNNLKISDEELEKRRTQELQHGRLAMLAILELLRHDCQMNIGGMYAGDEVMGRMITGLP
eukprot:CAMPEP_0117538650 /NCGR_PEP_ID=MMETSP0784-20121206/42587_1 /TAXON_ID=39447 /ORGANISM="" /LENGTH=183 /DNA_ID=CAMNT_0005335269 /DNA_START=75 /DNA_END=623 /DNA_ORIENTATION=-